MSCYYCGKPDCKSGDVCGSHAPKRYVLRPGPFRFSKQDCEMLGFDFSKEQRKVRKWDARQIKLKDVLELA